jgi:hypothetical protein
MFVIVVFTLMLREQASVAGLVHPQKHDGFTVDRITKELMAGLDSRVSHSVEMKLPIEQLRDAEGKITPNGESFFLLLARRTKSLSLNFMLKADSVDDVEFLTAIAARMLHEVALETTQIRVGMADRPTVADGRHVRGVTVTITRLETVVGDKE